MGLRFPPRGRLFHAISGVAIDLLKESVAAKGVSYVVVMLYALITCSISVALP